MKRLIYLAGLPRSGSTILANVLGMHPSIHSTPSSPLCSIIQDMRRHWSDDPFLLSQLDSNFDVVNERLKRSTMAFMQAWSDETKKPIVVDKNRGWLFNIEVLRELDPNFKIVVTLRDLRSVYASIEKRHRSTLFVEFPDHLEHNLVDARASSLFSDSGLIGCVLKAIQNVKDIPNISKHVYYWRFEDFIASPQKTTEHLLKYLDVEPIAIDFNNIVQSTTESDSHYHMKYPHTIKTAIHDPESLGESLISPRIATEIFNRFGWYYSDFYPLSPSAEPTTNPLSNPTDTEDLAMIRKLELAIQEETK